MQQNEIAATDIARPQACGDIARRFVELRVGPGAPLAGKRFPVKERRIAPPFGLRAQQPVHVHQEGLQQTAINKIAAWKVYDPEVNEYGSRGWEMPIGKTYTFGIEASF